MSLVKVWNSFSDNASRAVPLIAAGAATTLALTVLWHAKEKRNFKCASCKHRASTSSSEASSTATAPSATTATATPVITAVAGEGDKWTDASVAARLAATATQHGLDIKGARIRRTSSRFCLGVEHGDYNGTELFGVGTDRFIWMAFKPNGTNKVRMYSTNFPDDGVVSWTLGRVPPPASSGSGHDEKVAHSWARFAYGTDYILSKTGHTLTTGFDAVIEGNIPGGGMSRSASLSINLLLAFFDVHSWPLSSSIDDGLRIVSLAQQIENDYIGSPCGNLDQIMIYFAKAGFGTHYSPATRTIRYIPLGSNAPDFRIVCLDTGTVRPGLEKSSYKIRRNECEQLVALARPEFGITNLAAIKDQALFDQIAARFTPTHPNWVDRARYIFEAQRNFYRMMDAWSAGDVTTLGALFRADGHGLRDLYRISGPELESICDAVRSVPGVYGERMLGGGDKGASGALVAADSVDAVRTAVATSYTRAHPAYANRYAVHVCKIVDGIKVLDGLL